MAAPVAVLGAVVKTRAVLGVGKHLVALVLGLVLMTVLFVVVISGKQRQVCGVGEDGTVDAAAIVGPLPAGARSIKDLNVDQLRNAQRVIAEGRRSGVSDRGVVVGLATALQESGLRNYANDGTGGGLKPDQRGVRASMRLPHEAVGSDHGSVGVFQQQWPWWPRPPWSEPPPIRQVPPDRRRRSARSTTTGPSTTSRRMDTLSPPSASSAS